MREMQSSVGVPRLGKAGHGVRPIEPVAADPTPVTAPWIAGTAS